MADKETILILIDELIKEAQEAPQWKAESALRCLKKELLKEQKSTTFENDGHHIRCTNCGEYWCKTDIEGNKFPDRFCPNCGRVVKQDET